MDKCNTCKHESTMSYHSSLCNSCISGSLYVHCMEIGDTVRVKKDGSIGVIRMMEGSPPRKAYVDIEPGANANYVYIRMHVPAEHQYIQGEADGPDTLALNPYNIDELELVI